MQAPVVLLQQAPVTQGVGEQTVPSPWKVVPAAQLPELVAVVQAPVLLLQQAPSTQGVGEQVVPAPW